MKKIFYFITLIITSHLYAQVIYEPGYLITDTGEKLDGFIQNMEWLDSPVVINYKNSLNKDSQEFRIENLLEFSITDGVVYKKRKVKIDLSPVNRDRLSLQMAPEFEEQVVFLKVLIEGEASLYEYSGQGVTRYFYKHSDKKDFIPLIFKEYFVSDSRFATNETYKQELFKSLNCSSFNTNTFEKLQYKKENLTRFFEAFNKCKGSNYEIINDKSQVYSEEKKTRLRFKAGIRSSSYSGVFEGPPFQININEFTLGGPDEQIDFSNLIGIQFGLEGEFIFNFNRNKISALTEATYFSYKDEVLFDFESGPSLVSIDYSAIEISVGPRYSFFLSNDSRIFLNAQVVVPFNVNQSILNPNELRPIDEFNNLANFAAGAGFEIKDLSVEFKLQGSRTLVNDGRLSKYDNYSVTLGYAFF